MQSRQRKELLCDKQEKLFLEEEEEEEREKKKHRYSKFSYNKRPLIPVNPGQMAWMLPRRVCGELNMRVCLTLARSDAGTSSFPDSSLMQIRDYRDGQRDRRLV